MKHITITGTDLKITVNDEVISTNSLEIDSLTNTTIDTNLSSKENEWYPDGISKKTYTRHGIQVHRFAPLELLKNKLAKGDMFEQRVGRELPDYILIARDGVNYDKETAYQIYRNQQANWLLGPNLYKAYIYGSLYYNKHTGEQTKEPKGVNPYDEWERVSRPTMELMNNVLVASAGNSSQVLMEPWYVNVPDNVTPRFNRFLSDMMKRVTHQATERANSLRVLDGKPNPISERP